MSNNINRRAFVGLGLWTLGLAACGGNTQQQETSQPEAASDQSESGDSTSKQQEAGKIVDGVLVTPYDEGYSSGIHHATIEVADYGTIKLELNATNTPITVSNFAHLANNKFYDGLTFHRIIKDFMVQGGDPNGDGTGGSDLNIKGEFSQNGVTNAIQHKRGVISMARSSAPDSGSSQFFIMHADNDTLDGAYAAFGRVTEGMDVIDKLAEVPVENSNGIVAKANQPKITSVRMDD
ncbi:MAG: peptidylprolyl isomerase [Coriobacteriales bacterium]|nr:peptidylprolyl isomerase [Coriobacteriales bacterium]